MTGLLIFGCCFALGSISRFCFIGLTQAERRIKLRLMTFLLDFLWAMLTIAALALIAFFLCGGTLNVFMPIGVLLGFSVTAVII